MNALYKGLIASGVLALVGFYPLTRWLMAGLEGYSVNKIYLTAIIGLVLTALLVFITDYYTSTEFGPVKKSPRPPPLGTAPTLLPAWRWP